MLLKKKSQIIITKYQNIAINSFSIKHEHAHEVVVKNSGCITSHNKRGEQAFYTPAPQMGRGVYCFTSVRSSKIFFVALFSVTIDDRNLIFGHKRHIGIPYCG